MTTAARADPARAAPGGASGSVTGSGGTGAPASRPGGRLRSPSARAGGLVVAVAVLATVLLVSLAVGAKPIPLTGVWAALTAFDPAQEDHLIVQSLRLPRAVVALLVGVSLGLAGALMQGLTRNPLADPGILGVSAGASLAVVVGIFVFGVASLSGYVWFAFVGAGITSVAVYALGSLGREGATPVKLALAGAAVTAFLTSMTTAVLLVDTATLDQYRFWAVGSLTGRDLTVAAQVAPFVLAGTVMALLSGRSLNALALGDDVARSLGQKVGASRVYCAVAVVLLVGAATAAAGPIGFVGLTVPHVARAITGPDYRWVLAWSAVLAPLLLLVADCVGRVVARPGEVQVGIVTALIGAPVFIALVRRRTLAQV